MIAPPPASAHHDETSFFDYVAELQDVLRVRHEAAALRDWQTYAERARAPDEQLGERESALATLLQESDVLDLVGR